MQSSLGTLFCESDIVQDRPLRPSRGVWQPRLSVPRVANFRMTNCEYRMLQTRSRISVNATEDEVNYPIAQ